MDKSIQEDIYLFLETEALLMSHLVLICVFQHMGHFVGNVHRPELLGGNGAVCHDHPANANVVDVVIGRLDVQELEEARNQTGPFHIRHIPGAPAHRSFC